MCKLCKTNTEDNEHLIHLCDNVKNIWDITSRIVKFDIKWKHILIGFYHEHNKKIVTLNNFISTISTVIYKYKMFCRIKEIEENVESMESHIKASCKIYSHIYKKINVDLSNMFNKLYDTL